MEDNRIESVSNERTCPACRKGEMREYSEYVSYNPDGGDYHMLYLECSFCGLELKGIEYQDEAHTGDANRRKAAKEAWDNLKEVWRNLSK